MTDPPSPSSLGHGGADFPSTCWSRLMVPDWTRVDANGRRAVIEDLASRYWKPIYACLRMGFGKSAEDAKDLTQDFFIWMMESDFLAKPDPARGRFRKLLRVALKNYLFNVERAGRRIKRGGGKPVLAIDRIPEDTFEPRAGETPDGAFDAAWIQELLTDAAAALEKESTDSGKPIPFLVFKQYHLEGGSAEGSYRDVAARFGITEADVANHLARSKARFRALIAERVSQTVDGTRELQAEIDELFGGRI